MNSPSFKDLKPMEVRILIELKKRFNGSNNGEISLSCREAAEICKCSKDTSTKAIHGLVRHGFIKYRKKGVFTNRMASTFVLTFEKVNGRQETNDWKVWPHNSEFKTKSFMPDL